jgi:gamma-glutamylcysteine synthetase
VLERIVRHFTERFEKANRKRFLHRRVGAELKFPFVDENGQAASQEAIDGLWAYLESAGWMPRLDDTSGCVVGATCQGPMNDTMASCETGYCKTEFALAHVASLHELAEMISGLRTLLREFSDRSGNRFLGFGLQPVTPPSKHLEMKKSRNLFWERIFGSNRHITPEDGDDVHLFTVSASSQVHIDVTLDEAVRAVNVFNGFSGAQVALTANSNIWKGALDPENKCLGELFWDWWNPGADRYGVPSRPFEDLADYVRQIVMMKPVYVRRGGKPVGLPGYDSFFRYYCSSEPALGMDPEGSTVHLTPEPADIDQHSTFYWYNARVSRYYTLENRVCDQQPPDEQVCVAALTLGLASALGEAEEEIRRHDWDLLRDARVAACRDGLQASVNGLRLSDLAGRMLQIAAEGLKKRGLGEQEYLAPLRARQQSGRCPADEAEKLFSRGGVPALLETRSL